MIVQKFNHEKPIQLKNVFNKNAYVTTNERIKFKFSKTFYHQKIQERSISKKHSTCKKDMNPILLNIQGGTFLGLRVPR